MAIWRIEACKAESGYRSNASIYNLVRSGLWTKPVLIGLRSVGLTLPLFCGVHNPRFTRPFCAVPRTSVFRTASG